ncbi:MAG: HAMP domain-containing histidine kinase [Thermoleophilia bacterium]|nr:HAMP domain-containing histidine kinase [Thermoleophilia bacterium]
MTLRTRVAAAAGIAVAITAIALAVGNWIATRNALRAEIDRALVQAAGNFARVPQGTPADRAPQPAPGGTSTTGSPPTLPRQPFGGATGTVQMVSSTGTVSRPTGASALPVDDLTRRIADEGTGRYFRDVTVNGVELRVLTAGVGTRGAVQIARPLTEVNRTLDRMLMAVVAIGVGGIALAALLGAWVARTALAPVRRFTDRTEAIADDPDPSHRLVVAGHDELTRLARSFNRTLDALEASVESQRNLVADAGHELRTPLASLRTNIQVLEHADRLPPEDVAALREDIVAELDELTALVADVVELARGTRPGEVADAVQLDEVVTNLVERFQRRMPDVAFRCSLDDTVVAGEPERIGRAVSNLLDNARKWSPPGTEVEVTVRDGWVSVRDHGPGFSPADLPHVFDRFYRAADARRLPGSGLGLAIVRQAAEAHGGRAEAANAEGGGAVVRIRFTPVEAHATPSLTPLFD